MLLLYIFCGFIILLLEYFSSIVVASGLSVVNCGRLWHLKLSGGAVVINFEKCRTA